MPLPLNLAMTPLEIASAATLPEKIAWMACHFSPDGKDLTDLPQQLPEGSMLILDDSIPWCGQDADQVADTLQRSISCLRCSSLLLDFQRPHNKEMLRMVSAIVEALPCPVAVTPAYAKDLSCPVFLPPAPLHIPLEKHVNSWKNREIWLEVALGQVEISIDSKGAHMEQMSPNASSGGFFDEKLCCRYVTTIQENAIIFTLFDTPETLEQKLEMARSFGVTRGVGLYQELGTFLPGRFFSDRSIVDSGDMYYNKAIKDL